MLCSGTSCLDASVKSIIITGRPQPAQNNESLTDFTLTLQRPFNPAVFCVAPCSPRTTAYGRKLQTDDEGSDEDASDDEDNGGDSADDEDNDGDERDCTPCENLTDEQKDTLASEYEPAKEIVCDYDCLDGSEDLTHCNYFGIKQVCRGCGTCDDCTPCPGDGDDDDEPTPSPMTPDETPSPTDGEEPGIDGEEPGTPAPTTTPMPSPVTPDETLSPETSETPAPVEDEPTPSPTTPSPVAPDETPGPVTVTPDETPSPETSETPAPVEDEPTPSPTTPSPVTPDETPGPVTAPTPVCCRSSRFCGQRVGV